MLWGAHSHDLACAGLVTPNLYVAFGCAAAMGFGDATVVILAYSMFGRLFKGGNSKVRTALLGALHTMKRRLR